MNARILSAALPFVLALSQVQAADSKNKVIDAFAQIDPKTIDLAELKAKIISTPDPAHKSAMEITVDFAKPGVYPRVLKKVTPGTIDPKKFSGIRLSFKSDTETTFTVSLRTGEQNPDGRKPMYAVKLEGTPQWQDVVLPFSSFKSVTQKTFKDGQQVVFPGGQTILPEEWSSLKHIVFSFDVGRRGNADTAVVLIDNLELVSQ